MTDVRCRQCRRKAEVFVMDGEPYAWCNDCFRHCVRINQDLLALQVPLEEFTSLSVIVGVMES